MQIFHLTMTKCYIVYFFRKEMKDDGMTIVFDARKTPLHPEFIKALLMVQVSTNIFTSNCKLYDINRYIFNTFVICYYVFLFCFMLYCVSNLIPSLNLVHRRSILTLCIGFYSWLIKTPATAMKKDLL